VIKTATEERIKRLKAHLERENPAMARAVEHFQELDDVARKLGFMAADESYATKISWWPVVAVLGTYSAGKSTFINEFLGQQLQRTGNQAVDDKFTVICYGSEPQARQLPGMALDSDPRFPFYRISQNITTATGESKRIDAYLQLKTSNAEQLRGRIFIDSPGFDADPQRNSTLLITDHIIGLSDLVLVFFDARHPEPGAMTDTLKHLVADTINRQDADKFLYILNQIDNTVREDNPEEVVASWQRALAQSGLTAGRFYRIYAESAVNSGVNEQLYRRIKVKRDEDMKDIRSRIAQLDVDRAYRIAGMLEESGKHLRDVLVPRLIEFRRKWLKRSLWNNLIVFLLLGTGFVWWSLAANAWDGLVFLPLANMEPAFQLIFVALALVLAALLYSQIRIWTGRSVLNKIKRDDSLGKDRLPLTSAFEKNLYAWWQSAVAARPHRWSTSTRRRLDRLIASADTLVQDLNDRFTRPSGVDASNRVNHTNGGDSPAVAKVSHPEQSPSRLSNNPSNKDTSSSPVDGKDADQTLR